MKKLTKEQAVAEHRKMWNWIADQLENGSTSTVGLLKEEYCKINKFNLLEDCFCCEYARMQINNSNCKSCPILWGSEDNTDRFYCEYGNNGEMNKGLWWIAQIYSFKHKYEEAAKIARQIADLPERKD
jgi:hypothetical protein